MDTYKEKYNEALERAKEQLETAKGFDYKEGQIAHDIRETVYAIFPLLKESEDEKTRKALISFLKSPFVNENITDEKVAPWLAWLEKQGDSPIKWNKNTGGNKPQENYSVLMKTTHGIAEGEWKGEFWFQYRWAGIIKDSEVLSWIELSDLEKQGETVWSEETDDDAWMNDIISKLENNLQLNKAEIDWFKSIKQRIGGYYG